MTATADIRELWRTAQAACFDVDSTVSMDEGIDVLAEHCGKGAAVAAFTSQAMNGDMLFEDALNARLDLIKPDREDVATCLRAHPPRLSPGVAELFARLRSRGTAVFLISGGFRQMIAPLARELNIAHDRIIANSLRFDQAGAYVGFDPTEPTARSGGKARAVAGLKERFGYRPLIVVGDGATDLEARPPADGFIGYGGVAVRDKVKAGADWFVTDFRELLAALEKP